MSNSNIVSLPSFVTTILRRLEGSGILLSIKSVAEALVQLFLVSKVFPAAFFKVAMKYRIELLVQVNVLVDDFILFHFVINTARRDHSDNFSLTFFLRKDIEVGLMADLGLS